ncbi:restriction endonuclease subunit S [Levilactobacillus yonginensis]|uniref:restriction endonuclease subunit S n=1 Tax=Levilactobacillus yonginensis TaxID=1054041 RepID=UPI00345D5854
MPRLNKANELSEWNKLISTGTQANLNADKVKNFQMYLPKNHDEIKLISTFFKQIDNTIALHQRKLAKLKELKQGYLQKMFPQNASKFPQLRFKGFTNPWEQRRLGERFAERVDRSGDGEMLSVTIANGVVLANSLDRKDNSSSDKSNYKVVVDCKINPNAVRTKKISFL